MPLIWQKDQSRHAIWKIKRLNLRQNTVISVAMVTCLTQGLIPWFRRSSLASFSDIFRQDPICLSEKPACLARVSTSGSTWSLWCESTKEKLHGNCFYLLIYFKIFHLYKFNRHYAGRKWDNFCSSVQLCNDWCII